MTSLFFSTQFLSPTACCWPVSIRWVFGQLCAGLEIALQSNQCSTDLSLSWIQESPEPLMTERQHTPPFHLFLFTIDFKLQAAAAECNLSWCMCEARMCQSIIRALMPNTDIFSMIILGFIISRCLSCSQYDGAAYFGRGWSGPEAVGIPFARVSAHVYPGLKTEGGSQRFMIHWPYSKARAGK